MFKLLMLEIKTNIYFAILKIGIIFGCSIFLYVISSHASMTFLFMLSFAVITLIPLVFSLITVSASTNVDSTEVIAATSRGLKWQIMLQFLHSSFWGIAGSCILYAFLSMQEFWPRNEGWVTLLYFLLGLAILSLIGILSVFISGTSRGGFISTIIAWMILSFMVDPFLKSLLLARVFPLAIIIVCSFAAIRKVEGGKLLLVSNF